MASTTLDASRLLAFREMLPDRSAVPQARLNIEERSRTNPLAWRGQFSPQFVNALLDTFARPGYFVLDPFVGSGTVLHEAAREHLPALGTEVNPAAAVLARIHTLSNLTPEQRQEVLQRLREACEDLLPIGPLFDLGPPLPPSELAKTLAKKYHNGGTATLRLLLAALVVTLDIGKQEPTPQRVSAALRDLTDLVMALPFSEALLDVQLTDARNIPLESHTVDLVLSSPPYINVFNYHQQYRRSVEALGWQPLAAARSEFGSNRKHRQNRFLTVTQFCLDIAEALYELQRVAKLGSRLILVLGRESMVRKTPFYNGEIVARLATHALRMPVLLRQERVFQNRYGQDIYEDILHFENSGQEVDHKELLRLAREVAETTLKEASDRVPIDSLPGLQDALAMVEEVMPSQRFDPNETLPNGAC